MTENARATVNAGIDALRNSHDRFRLLDQNLWAAFITETGIVAEKIPDTDERILSRNVELRESAAG